MIKFATIIINHDEEKWERDHFRTLRRGIYLKFSQNPDLLKKLSLTNGRRLVYANKEDRFYGNGTSPDCCVIGPENSEGFNLLGYILMDIRDEFLNEWIILKTPLIYCCLKSWNKIIQSSYLSVSFLVGGVIFLFMSRWIQFQILYSIGGVSIFSRSEEKFGVRFEAIFSQFSASSSLGE